MNCTTSAGLGNAPESEAITLDDVTVFEAARSAIGLLKKTFESWVMIGKAVVRARKIADERGGGKTFMRLIDQQGLGRVVNNKTTASNLLRIMERLPEVTKWHEKLTEKQQIQWAAPTTILGRCPVFKKAKPVEEGEPVLSEKQQLKQSVSRLEAEVHQLKRQKEDERFTPTDTAENVAVAIVGMFSAAKVKDIIQRAQRILEERGPEKKKTA